jgi:hypothetical protein
MTKAERAAVAPKIAAINTSRTSPSTRLATVPAAMIPADRAIAPAVDAPAAASPGADGAIAPGPADAAAGVSEAVMSGPL